METDGVLGERRRGQRVPLSGELVIFVENTGQFLERHGRDISEGGMFLTSPAPPPPGTRLRFLIQPSGGSGLIRGLAEVAWRREEDEGPDRPAGMGLRFLSMNPEGQALIRRFVAERSAEAGPFTRPAALTPPTETAGEPFAIEPGMPAPTPEPVEDVFEAEAAPEAGRDTAETRDEPAHSKPETLLDRPLPEIGRPFNYDEQEVIRRRRKGRLFIFAIVLGIAVLAALAAWYAGWLGAPGTRGGAVSSHRTAQRQPTAAPSVPPASPVASVPSPAMPVPALAVRPTATAAPPATPSATATPTPFPTPSPVPAPPVRAAHAIRHIRWSRSRTGTTIRIEPAGTLTSRRVHIIRLDDPPRVLIRLRGIRTPYPQPVIQVHTGELIRMRVWLHNEYDPPELYVVLDLADANVRAAGHLRPESVVVTLTHRHAR